MREIIEEFVDFLQHNKGEITDKQKKDLESVMKYLRATALRDAESGSEERAKLYEELREKALDVLQEEEPFEEHAMSRRKMKELYMDGFEEAIDRLKSVSEQYKIDRRVALKNILSDLFDRMNLRNIGVDVSKKGNLAIYDLEQYGKQFGVPESKYSCKRDKDCVCRDKRCVSLTGMKSITIPRDDPSMKFSTNEEALAADIFRRCNNAAEGSKKLRFDCFIKKMRRLLEPKKSASGEFVSGDKRARVLYQIIRKQ